MMLWPLNEVITLVRYAVTDQEKEGREAGIKAAAKIYEPVLRDMERQQAKILADLDKEQIDFEYKAKFLINKCSVYEKNCRYICINQFYAWAI